MQIDAATWFDNQTDLFVRNICDLARIPSVSVKTENPEMPFGPECRKVLDACLDLGKSMGFESFNHENYCGTLLWRGEKRSEIGFFGHADVVPAGEGWHYPPFEPTVENGLVIGRGVSDNKGSLLAALYALRYLKETGYQPRHSMRFFFGCSEETTMEDIEYYTSHYEEPVFSLVADCRFPGAYGEKGLLELDAERVCASGVLASFRSGVLDRAAASLMEDCVAFFGDYYGRSLNIEYSDPESGRLTHVGGMASYQDGVFHQNINIRYSVTAMYEELVERIREIMSVRGFEITRVHHSGPNYVDPQLPVIQKLAEISNRILGTDLKPVVIGGGTYARKLKRAIAFGMGMPVRRMSFGNTRGGAH